MNIKMAATWCPVNKKYDEEDITPYVLLKVKERFGGTYRLNLLGRRVSQARNQHEEGSKQTSRWFLAWLIFFINTEVRISNPTKYCNDNEEATKISWCLWCA
jgi:hypothetical protein